MKATVIFRSAAEEELQDAHDWYEEREAGLGKDFLRCVDACVQRLRRYPELYPLIYRRVRQGVVRRFPYTVIYLVEAESIIVLSVFHASRDPVIWRRGVE